MKIRHFVILAWLRRSPLQMVLDAGIPQRQSDFEASPNDVRFFCVPLIFIAGTKEWPMSVKKGDTVILPEFGGIVVKWMTLSTHFTGNTSCWP